MMTHNCWSSRSIKCILMALALLWTSTSAYSQSEAVDSVTLSSRRVDDNPYRFSLGQLAVPAVLIGVGAAGLSGTWLKHSGSSGGTQAPDNIARFVPLATMFGLRLCGVKGRHNYVDMTVVSATAYAIMGVTVASVKGIVRSERPDGSDMRSFPSGHAAAAFVGAELLRREYWNVSPWIGVGGYAVAVGTAALRLHHGRHWINDVLAGAGVGILSAQAAYWLYPVISHALFPRRDNTSKMAVTLAPCWYGRGGGIACAMTF